MGKKIESAKRPTYRMLSAVELSKPAVDSGYRKFRIHAYTGAKVETWWGSLVIDVAGMTMKEKMPILREHARDRVVGWGEEFKKEGGQLVIEGPFSKATKDAEEVLQLADEGFPWQASVGVWPKRVEVVEKGTFQANGKTYEGPCEVWRESFVGETSFCSIGADSDTAAISMSGSGEHRVEIEREEPDQTTTQEVKMDKEKLMKEHPELYASLVKEIGEAATAAERSRIVEIRGSAFSGMDALTDQCISEGLSADEARKRFIAAEKEKKQDRLETLKKGSPADTGANLNDGKDPVAQLPEGEEKWKAEFNRSKELQDEFKRVEAYIGFKRADSRGRVKIFRKD